MGIRPHQPPPARDYEDIFKRESPQRSPPNDEINAENNALTTMPPKPNPQAQRRAARRECPRYHKKIKTQSIIAVMTKQTLQLLCPLEQVVLR
ncbi:MAG: hypothetical protein GC192_12590 [Bacteroidetes bacterium]|nr:hypothetical protein [Bacteroidota bacterium]